MEESPSRTPLREPSRESPKESEEVPATPEEDHPITITTTPAKEPPIPVVEEEPTTGTSVSCITIAYPLQSSLECPHCMVQYSGERLEDLCKHLRDSHSEIPQDWTYLCALCADRKGEEEDMIGHLLTTTSLDIHPPLLPEEPPLTPPPLLQGPPPPAEEVGR